MKIIMKQSGMYIILFMLNATTFNCKAQSFFNQNGAWIKNQIRQIALWEVYIKDIEKGYDIAKQGLDAISAVKNGDFHLHLDHFNSLMDVNPEIKKYSKAVEILLMQSDIKKVAVKINDNYIKSVWRHLINSCEVDANQLKLLLSPGNYQMTDDERIRNIDKLYIDMKDKYWFAKSFSSDNKILSLQKLKEKNEVQTSRLLNNINP
jgi:hypothetical protein